MKLTTPIIIYIPNCGVLETKPYSPSNSTSAIRPSTYLENINIPIIAPITIKKPGRKTSTPTKPSVYTIRNIISELFIFFYYTRPLNFNASTIRITAIIYAASRKLEL